MMAWDITVVETIAAAFSERYFERVKSLTDTKKQSSQVASGKALAARVKELGHAGDWKGVLQALGEIPKNAIVCT